MAANFADHTLRRRLSWGAGPLDIALPQAGGNSLVYIIKPPAAPPAVLYLFRKWRPWRDSQEALRLGEARRLPLPRLLDAGSPWFDFPLRGHFFLTTDFAEGRDLVGLDWDPGTLDVLATTLARLHAVEADRPGKLRRRDRRPIRESWRASIRSRIDDIRRHPEAPDPAMIDRIDAWFSRTIDALPDPPRFQLCHHHLFADDIILDPSRKKMTVIDCANLQFSRASRDLGCVRRGLFPDRTDLWFRFLDAYFSRFPVATRAEWEAEIPLFEAFYLLVKLRHATGRPARVGPILAELRHVCGFD